MLNSRLIPVPPQIEQQRISVKARELVSLISNIENDKESVVGIVANAKSKIFDLAIRGQFVPQDPADEPAYVLLSLSGLPGDLPLHLFTPVREP